MNTDLLADFLATMLSVIVVCTVIYLLAMLVLLIIYLVCRKKKKLTKQGRVYLILLACAFTALEGLTVVPVALDAVGMPDTMVTVDFVSAELIEDYSDDASIITTDVAVELTDGSHLTLKAVGDFPEGVRNSSLTYGKHSDIITSYVEK